MASFFAPHAIESSAPWYDHLREEWEAREALLEEIVEELLASDEGRVDAFSEIDDGSILKMAAACFRPDLPAEELAEYRAYVWQAMEVKTRKYAKEVLEEREQQAKADWADMTRPDDLY